MVERGSSGRFTRVWAIVEGTEEWLPWSNSEGPGWSLQCQITSGKWQTDYSFSLQGKRRNYPDQDEVRRLLVEEVNTPGVNMLLGKRVRGTSVRKQAQEMVAKRQKEIEEATSD